MRGLGELKSKHGVAKKTHCSHHHLHDSRKEAKRCDELHLLERAGVISRLTHQPQFWFSVDGRQIKHDNGRRVGIKLDFQYFEGDRNVVEDVKAGSIKADSRDYPLRKSIFRALFPYIEMREVR